MNAHSHPTQLRVLRLVLLPCLGSPFQRLRTRGVGVGSRAGAGAAGSSGAYPRGLGQIQNLGREGRARAGAKARPGDALSRAWPLSADKAKPTSPRGIGLSRRGFALSPGRRSSVGCGDGEAGLGLRFFSGGAASIASRRGVSCGRSASRSRRLALGDRKRWSLAARPMGLGPRRWSSSGSGGHKLCSGGRQRGPGSPCGRHSFPTLARASSRPSQPSSVGLSLRPPAPRASCRPARSRAPARARCSGARPSGLNRRTRPTGTAQGAARTGGRGKSRYVSLSWALARGRLAKSASRLCCVACTGNSSFSRTRNATTSRAPTPRPELERLCTGFLRRACNLSPPSRGLPALPRRRSAARCSLSRRPATTHARSSMRPGSRRRTPPALSSRTFPGRPLRSSP